MENVGTDPFEQAKWTEQARQQADQQVQRTQQATAGQIDNFKKAFSVCLEVKAKDYLLKY